MRVILTETSKDADEALSRLEQDSSEKSFEQVAEELSIDEATKSTGGLREAVVEGQSEPALDEQIFAAPEGELVGPFETDAGFYVIRVEKTVPAETTPLDDVREQIRQTLVSARQQEVTAAFQEDFQSKWVARTVCAEEYADRALLECAPRRRVPARRRSPRTRVATRPCPRPARSRPGPPECFGAPAPPGPAAGPDHAAGRAPGRRPAAGAWRRSPAAPPGTAPPGAAPPGTVPPG